MTPPLKPGAVIESVHTGYKNSFIVVKNTLEMERIREEEVQRLSYPASNEARDAGSDVLESFNKENAMSGQASSSGNAEDCGGGQQRNPPPADEEDRELSAETEVVSLRPQNARNKRKSSNDSNGIDEKLRLTKKNK